MKTVKITILASDILEARYGFSRECAMTKAFQRAGLDIREAGGYIHSNINRNEFPTPEDLNEKVIAMYAWADRNDPEQLKMWNSDNRIVNPIPPADFDYELTIPD